MATAATYPKISKKLWWLIRDRFKKTLPTVVTTTLVTSLSSMEEASARSNVLSPLRELGLLDQENEPTDLATRWRHDDEYAAVCHEIRKETYPAELIEAFPEPGASHKEKIKTWFMKVGNVGESAARMYADTYLLLSQADPTKREETASSAAPARTVKSKATIASKTRTPVVSKPSESNSIAPEQVKQHPPEAPASAGHHRVPAIHIDVQVHISPDTSAEQIDRIFESMAKHLGAYIK